jgi:hypothetical protein
MADAGLDHLAPWLEGYLQRLEPAARRPFLRKLAKALRDANARRIRDNVEPDGTPMAPAKASATAVAACAAARPACSPRPPSPATCAPRPAPKPSPSASAPDRANRPHPPLRRRSPRRSPHPQLNPHPLPRPLLLGLSEADIAMIEADTLGLLG